MRRLRVWVLFGLLALFYIGAAVDQATPNPVGRQALIFTWAGLGELPSPLAGELTEELQQWRAELNGAQR